MGAIMDKLCTVVAITVLVGLAGCANYNPPLEALPSDKLVHTTAYTDIPRNYKQLIHDYYFTGLHRLMYVSDISFNMSRPEKCYRVTNNGKVSYDFGHCVQVTYSPFNMFHQNLGRRTDTFIFSSNQILYVQTGSGNIFIVGEERNPWD